jgi:SAM-dependent methyltransferase
MSQKKLQIEDRSDWTESYGDFSAIYPNARNFINFLQEFKDIKQAKIRVLEYGCGPGFYLKLFKHDNPTAELYGVDIAKEAIESSIYNTGIPRSHFFWQSCEQSLPMSDNFFDIIYGLDIIEHIESNNEIEKWFLTAKRLLKDDGIFIIICPNCNWLMRRIYDFTHQAWIYNGKAHKRFFNLRSLSRWTQKYFYVKYKGLYNHRPKAFKKLLKLFGVSKHIVVILQKYES